MLTSLRYAKNSLELASQAHQNFMTYFLFHPEIQVNVRSSHPPYPPCVARNRCAPMRSSFTRKLWVVSYPSARISAPSFHRFSPQVTLLDVLTSFEIIFVNSWLRVLRIRTIYDKDFWSSQSFYLLKSCILEFSTIPEFLAS